MGEKIMELTFEEAMDELEKKVEMLEKGDLPLEDALECFKQGITMVKICKKKLGDAETIINELIEDEEGNIALVPLGTVDKLES